jgi:anti-sigma regulatory factor (Ser/Thr protein kinase)
MGRSGRITRLRTVRSGYAGGIAEHLHLPSAPQAVAAARQTVGEVLEQEGYTGDRAVVALLVSEVVTNAVVHAGTALEVVVRAAEGEVSVDVIDGDVDHLSELRTATSHDTSGRGMTIVDALADRWGCELVDPHHKRVWFSIASVPA